MISLQQPSGLIWRPSGEFDSSSTVIIAKICNYSPSDPIIKLEQRKLKNNGEFINIHVMLVSSPQNFVFLLQEDIDEFNNMTIGMQSYCNSSPKLSTLSDVKKGECYAVYDEDSRKWIR